MITYLWRIFKQDMFIIIIINCIKTHTHNETGINLNNVSKAELILGLNNTNTIYR